MRLAIAMGLALAACAAPAASPERMAAPEMAIRQDIIDTVKRHVFTRDFAALDALEAKFVSPQQRTPSGIWKLRIYYAATQGWLPSPTPQSGCADVVEPFLAAWRKASPQSPAAIIVTARAQLERAWCYRGTGWNNTVPGTAWAPFHNGIAMAADTLEQGKAIAARDPEYAATSIRIGVAQGKSPGDILNTLGSVTGDAVYYYDMWFDAFRYFQPKWHGSLEDQDALAQLAAKMTAVQDGDGAYARVYWYAMECGCLPEVYDVDWPRMRRAMRDLSARYPDAWNHANFAKMACKLDHPEEARHYLTLLNWREVDLAWPDPDEAATCFEQARAAD
jgi:hypothetical protein